MWPYWWKTIVYIYIVLLLKLEECPRYHILSAWQWLITIHRCSNSFHWKISKAYLQKDPQNITVMPVNIREKVAYLKRSHLNMQLVAVWDGMKYCICFWENIMHMFPQPPKSESYYWQGTGFFASSALWAMFIIGLPLFYSCCYDQPVPTGSESGRAPAASVTQAQVRPI